MKNRLKELDWSSKIMEQKWYAMYRGDTFIDLGTADYLAEKYHKKKQSLLYLSKPAYHRNAPKNSQRLTLYKMEDQAIKETKEESPLMKKLSDILADKNDDYYITAAGSTISIYYCKCKLFEVVLDEINNPRFLFDGMQQTEIEASRITVLISALKIVRDFVNENLVRIDVKE